jgi:hypothetical protein
LGLAGPANGNEELGKSMTTRQSGQEIRKSLEVLENSSKVGERGKSAHVALQNSILRSKIGHH